jgi:uroporphyrinogen-III synthase
MSVSNASSIGPLTGTSVVITRPVGRCLALERRVVALGGTPLRLSGSSLRPPLNKKLAHQQLVLAAHSDIQIYVSPTSVRYAWLLCADYQHKLAKQTFAVGPTTAKALQKRGVCAHLPIANYTSEGLLNHPQLQSVQGKTISIIAAPDGRTVLADALRARGAQVRVIMVYRRVPARWSTRQKNLLASASPPRLWLISSIQTLNQLKTRLLASEWYRLKDDWLIVASARIADTAIQLGCRRVRVAQSALTQDLLKTAISAISN